MIKKIRLDNQPTTLKIVVATKRVQKIWIKVADPTKKNTYYIKRFANVKGKKSFFVNMPVSPMVADVIVYNANNGLSERDRSFKVLSIKRLPLKVKPLMRLSKKTLSFLRFAEEFCQSAGYIPSSTDGETYKSNNGKFRIDYFNVIRSKGDKSKISTPARISQLTGKIEVSAKAFRKYTIPMRMAILMHEFSHFYVNEVPSDESEADINGLKIYFTRGYPKISAYNVFLNVFKRSPSMQNKQRYEKLDNFIRDYKEQEDEQ